MTHSEQMGKKNNSKIGRHLKEIAGEYKLDAAECSVGALADVAHVKVEPVEKLGLKRVGGEMRQWVVLVEGGGD